MEASDARILFFLLSRNLYLLINVLYINDIHELNYPMFKVNKSAYSCINFVEGFAVRGNFLKISIKMNDLIIG